MAGPLFAGRHRPAYGRALFVLDERLQREQSKQTCSKDDDTRRRDFDPFDDEYTGWGPLACWTGSFAALIWLAARLPMERPARASDPVQRVSHSDRSGLWLEKFDGLPPLKVAEAIPIRPREVEPEPPKEAALPPKPTPLWDGQEPGVINLISAPRIARVGNMVVLVARVATSDGKPVKGAPVEWWLDRRGAGEIIEASWPTDKPVTERVRTPLYSHATTATAPYRLSLNLAGIDGMEIGLGETWCVVSSGKAGDMTVTVRTPSHLHRTQQPATSADPSALVAANLANAAGRRTVGHVHWDHASAIFPTKQSAPIQGKVPLVTTITYDDTGREARNYTVRYSLAETSGATLPNGMPSLDVISDSRGLAPVLLTHHGNDAGMTKVKVELLGRHDADVPETILASDVFEVDWQRADRSLSVHGPETVGVGEWVPLQVKVDRRDTVLAEERLHVVPTAGAMIDSADGELAITLVSSPKPAPSEHAYRVTSLADGAKTFRFELRAGQQVLATASKTVAFTSPKLVVSKQYVKEWKIGESNAVKLTVRNEGLIAARDVRLTDFLPAGMSVARTDGLRMTDRVLWRIGTLEPKQEKTVSLIAVPTSLMPEIAVPVQAEARNHPLVEEYAMLAVGGLPALAIEVSDRDDPVTLDTAIDYDVVVSNRGTAAATGIHLQGELTNLTIQSAQGNLPTKVADGRLEFGTIPRLAPGEILTCRIAALATKAGESRLAVAIHDDDQKDDRILSQESTIIMEAPDRKTADAAVEKQPEASDPKRP